VVGWTLLTEKDLTIGSEIRFAQAGYCAIESSDSRDEAFASEVMLVHLAFRAPPRRRAKPSEMVREHTG
jgi:hypothetical protein